MSPWRVPRSESRLARVLGGGGADELAKRVARKMYRSTGAIALEFPLRSNDVTDSDSVRRSMPTPTGAGGDRLRIGWLCSPPGPGSGGHTTMFRMIEGLEAAGHTCIVHLYDPHGVDLNRYTDIIRRHWSSVRAEVVDVDGGLVDADAFVATSWQSAHVLGSRPQKPGRRMYFAQDYEPYFYPRGSEYALAEDTYRFGFDILALGHMVHDEILTHTGVQSTLLPFGCDTDVYRLRNTGARNGIAFYSRPDTARRGSVLAALGLDLFHARRPDQTIHLIGERPSMMSAPVVEHGHLTPEQLAELYNSTLGGIGMSFTNISLVVEEMLMCGAVPVVNDSSMARADIDHPGVEWSAATPNAIADALCRVVDHRDVHGRAVSLASIVRPESWCESVRSIVAAIEWTVGRVDTR